MKREKAYFGVGLVMGVVFGALFFLQLAPRYQSLVLEDNSLVRQDTWSGAAWRLEGEKWEKVPEDGRNWKTVDDVLVKALHIPTGNVDIEKAVSLLRTQHPILHDVSDTDLLERIKIVYSKQVLCGAYLSNILNKGQESVPH